MSEDYDTKRTNIAGSSSQGGSDKPAVEDPLIELARIVHNNKNNASAETGGRVEATDYFAALDDLAGPGSRSSDTSRQEPAFSDPANRDPEPLSPDADAPLSGGQTAYLAEPAGPHPTAFQAPSAPAVELGRGFSDAEQPNVSAAPSVGASFEPVAVTETTPPAPTSDLDLNLTAGLEDELIGALQRSVEAPPQETEQPAAGDFQSASFQPSHGAGFAAQSIPAARAPEPEEPVIPEVRQGNFSVSGYRLSDNAQTDPAIEPAETPAAEVFGEPVQDQPVPSPDPFDLRRTVSEPAPADRKPEFSAQTAPRPAIDEADFFAALNDPAASTSPDGAADQTSGSAGIDAIFADLDFPDPADRQKAAEPQSAGAELFDGQKQSGSVPEDIDDLTWPEAAASVPHSVEDETPPPPGGYDLDAVARAMQESDPSLRGAGVLPPHPAAEKSAAPMAGEKSRRGLYVAAGVLGVAVLGSAAFFFLDQNSGTMPDGPPPVISGLQEPLKIFPENVPAGNEDQSAKLIYDRVGGTDANGPSTLKVPESPEPASLPPAPNETVNGAELVPGAPKRVRTLVVKPDGTIISGPDAAGANSQSSAAPSTAGDTPRVVSTTPIVAGSPEPQQSEPPAPAPAVPVAAVPVPADPASSADSQPSIVSAASGNQQTAPAVVTTEPVTAQEPAPTQPVAPVPTVLPRAKPPAPVRVAQAPAQAPAQVAPQPQQNTGPLNLTQPAAAPAQSSGNAGASNTGTIPAGTYIVQVTSQRSAAAASDAYSGLQRRYPGILANRNAVIVAADLGDRGVFYRARLPMGSRDEAVRLCEQLQGAGGDCFVRRSP